MMQLYIRPEAVCTCEHYHCDHAIRDVAGVKSVVCLVCEALSRQWAVGLNKRVRVCGGYEYSFTGEISEVHVINDCTRVIEC